MSRCLRLIVPALLAIFLFSISTLAQQAPPSADTFASSATPTTNYGSSVILVVASGNNTYMKFNLSGVPAGPSVSKATLRLFVDAVVTGGQFDVYNLPGTPSWSESTLKYNTPPPALGASATGGHPITVSTSSYNTFVLIDITSTVQGWLTNPSSNNGVALALVGSTGWFSFDSKESFFTAHQPELEIVLNGPAGVQGATGATGATGPMGPIGAMGPQGVAGPTGPFGATGPKGDTGSQGPAGTNGTNGVNGATGATGAMGPMGLTGLVGPQGTAGTNGTNGAGFTFRNAFSSSTTYATNDVVTFNGSTYLAIGANGPSNSNPDVNPAWTLMAQQGATGATGPAGSAGANGAQGPQGFPGPQGSQGATGPQGPAGSAGADPNSRMIFPSFYPGNLSGSWVGGQFTLDQAITVLRIAAVAKTPTGSACPAAVFRLTNGSKGQDLVLTPGGSWSDTGAMVMTFAAGDVLQASLRTGSTCPSNTGADANLLVEYKMQAAGDTDSCAGTQCAGNCTTAASDPANCGACGITCANGAPCASGTCGSGGSGCNPPLTQCGNTCTSTSTDPKNCGVCGQVCAGGQACLSGTCFAASACVGANGPLPAGTVVSTPPGTCQQLQCDGNGKVISVADNANVPNAAVCTVGICTAGVPSTNFAPAGSSCGNSLICNGSGGCVSQGCQPGFMMCGNTCINTSSDRNNCGGCGLVCSTANGTPACINSACAIASCNAGFGDCNTVNADGCETNLNTSASNCGACGKICAPPPNASALCAQGGCAIGACNAGFGDCNGVLADGCETNLNTSATNCGACGKACAGGQSCVNSLCVSQIVHSNGLGQNYTDNNPLGTYNAVTATEAAIAFSGTVTTTGPVVCSGGAAAISGTSGTACGVWIYSGPSFGHVHSDPSSCLCPVVTDPVWN